jgi:hypothetical protein
MTSYGRSKTVGVPTPMSCRGSSYFRAARLSPRPQVRLRVGTTYGPSYQLLAYFGISCVKFIVERAGILYVR